MRFFRERSLEDLCLNTVVTYLGNSHSLSALGEKYNTFLRKRYSDRIYSILKKTGCINEDLIDWLISPYWNDITVEKTHSIPKLIPKFIFYGNKITSVSFENSSTSVKILSAVVCLLPHLKSLNLSGTSCTDDLLILIRKMCPELSSLSLFECNVTDDGMKNLCYVNRKKVGFDSLKVLNIEKTKVKSNGIAYILRNLKLQVIKYPEIATILYYFHLSKVNKYVDVSKIYELKELEYSSNKLLSTISFLKILEVWVNMCPNVEKLAVVDWLSECDFELCLRFENLNLLNYLTQEILLKRVLLTL
nr:uncharacterized protein LOC107439634 [Parasteatoda tepidariorum]